MQATEEAAGGTAGSDASNSRRNSRRNSRSVTPLAEVMDETIEILHETIEVVAAPAKPRAGPLKVRIAGLKLQVDECCAQMAIVAEDKGLNSAIAAMQERVHAELAKVWQEHEAHLKVLQRQSELLDKRSRVSGFRGREYGQQQISQTRLLGSVSDTCLRANAMINEE
jgi:hypothetical protein